MDGERPWFALAADPDVLVATVLASEGVASPVPVRRILGGRSLWHTGAGLSLTYIGRVDDRMRRPGDAYIAEATTPNGQRTQFMVIIDSQTGALLDYERTLLHTTPGQFILPPAVIQYRLYITSPTHTNQQEARCAH